MNGWVLPARTPLAQVFEWCWRERKVDRLLLSAVADVDRKTKGLVPRKSSIDATIASLFGERLIERKFVRRWPGTTLSYDKAIVYLIAFEPCLIKPMAALGRKVEDWRHTHQPPLPEDPCLFRQGDEWPVLVSVTHERDAWILSEARPPFCLKKPFDFEPENLLIPSAPGFVED